MSITSGRNRANCSVVQTGGVAAIYLAPQADIDSVTLTGNLVSGITMVATKVFYKFQFKRDTAFFNEEMTNENGSAQFAQSIQMIWSGRSQEDIDHLAELLACSNCGLAAVIEFNNGTKFLVGQKDNEYLEVPSATMESGTLKSDAVQSTVNLAGTSSGGSPTFTAVVPV